MRYDADADTIHALRAATARVERALGRVLEPFGITPAQFELLQVIEHYAESGAGCSELGKHLAVPVPDVTRMLDRLDSALLVSRKRNDKDRRVVHTALTQKARQLLHDAASPVAEVQASVFVGLGAEPREQLTALLHGVRRNCPGN